MSFTNGHVDVCQCPSCPSVSGKQQFFVSGTPNGCNNVVGAPFVVTGQKNNGTTVVTGVPTNGTTVVATDGGIFPGRTISTFEIILFAAIAFIIFIIIIAIIVYAVARPRGVAVKTSEGGVVAVRR